jgi:hypothetical protein
VTAVAADPNANANLKNQWGTQPKNLPQGNYNLTTHQRRVQAIPRHDLRNNVPRGNAGNQNMGALSRGNYNDPNAPHVPRREAPDAAGRNYNLN